MLSKKQFFAIFLFLFAVFSTFSEGYGFSSNHEGFFAWVGLIALSVVVVIIADLIVWTAYEKFDLNAEYGYTNILLVSYGIIAGLFSILSIWILPTYFLSIYACIFALVPIIPSVHHKGIFPKIASILVAVDMFFMFAFATKNILQELWWCKYLLIAIVEYLVSESLSYMHKENLSKLWLSYALLIAITLTSILSNLFPVLAILLFVFIFATLYFGKKSFKIHSAKVAYTMENTFGMSKKEIKKLLQDFKSNIPYFYGDRDDLYTPLERALDSFFKEDQNKCIENLEEFFKVYEEKGEFIKSKIKGKKNRDIFKKFFDIAMNLRNELYYDDAEYSSAEDFEDSISIALLNEKIHDMKVMYQQIKEYEESAGKQLWSWVQKIKTCIEDAEDESLSIEERYRRAVEGITHCKDYEEVAQTVYGSTEEEDFESEENTDSSESESCWENYYEILFGEDFDKSRDYTKIETSALKKQYRKMVKKYHPDRANEDQKEEFTEIMNKLNQIWEVLSDPDKRTEYDKSYSENL